MFMMLWDSDQVASIPGFQNPFGDIVSYQWDLKLCYNLRFKSEQPSEIFVICVFTRWHERKYFRSSFRWSLKDSIDKLCCPLAVSRATTCPSNRKHFAVSWPDMLTVMSDNIYRVLVPISIFFTALTCSRSYFSLRKFLLFHCTKS